MLPTRELYDYVGGRPATLFDPSGLVPLFQLGDERSGEDQRFSGAMKGLFNAQIGAPPTPDEIEALMRPIGEKISCDAFLAWVAAHEDDLPEEVQNAIGLGAHIYCADCGFDGGLAYPGDMRCHVCLPGIIHGTGQTDKKYLTAWIALLLHESIHCVQFNANYVTNPRGVKRTVIFGEVPDTIPGLRPWPSCRSCTRYERRPYAQQCDLLFHNDPAAYDQCVDAGLCRSCQHACPRVERWHPNCPTKPEYPSFPL